MAILEHPFLRAALKGAATGMALSAWVLAILALSRLVVSPHLGEMGMLNLTAEQALNRLSPKLAGYVSTTLPALAAQLVAALTLAGVLAGAVLHLINPQRGAEVRDAMHLAAVAIWPVPCLAAAILLAQAVLLSQAVDYAVFACLVVWIVLLPFSCLRPEVVRGTVARRWWRPAFPGWRPLGIWVAAFLLSSLVDSLDVGSGLVELLSGLATTFVAGLILLAGAISLVFRLDWKSLLRTLKSSHLRTLIGAWIDLNARFFVGVSFVAFPLLCLGIIAYFVEPQVAEAARARGTSESLFFVSLRFIFSSAAREANALFLAIVAVTAYWWLACARLLHLLRESDVVVVDEQGADLPGREAVELG